MKLRIIKKDEVYIPQFYGKNYCAYYSAWLGFGRPILKFGRKEVAVSFIEAVEKAVPSCSNNKKAEVVWQNKEALEEALRA